MKKQVVILGAGPAGLSAAYALLKNNVPVTIIERENVAGGLMRSVKHSGFSVDFGYKHLYLRIPEVAALWCELLGSDFIRYIPRTGILYQGKIIEKDKIFRGLLRGMSFSLLTQATFRLVSDIIYYRHHAISTLEDYARSRRGALFTEIFTQAFDERFKGRKWSDLPAPEIQTGNVFPDFFQDAAKSTFIQPEWFHPAGGSGQIVERLEEEIRIRGGNIMFNTNITNLQTSGQKIAAVDFLCDGKTNKLQIDHVISGIPIRSLAKLLKIPVEATMQNLSFRRGVILVYLFFNKPVDFPHSSIQVADKNLRIGRITNYGAINHQMVPEGKSCLCIEYFTLQNDDLYHFSDKQLCDLTLVECEKNKLFQRISIDDYLVFRNRNSDPAASWEDYITEESKMELFRNISTFSNLYQTNRTGTDRSTYAGLMAAESVLNNNRFGFDIKARPDVPAPRI